MIPEYKRKSRIAVGFFLAPIVFAFLFGALGYSSDDSKSANVFSSLVPLVIMISYPVACWFYIKAKGRSGWWLLTCFLVGPIAIWMLKDHAKEDLPPGAV